MVLMKEFLEKHRQIEPSWGPLGKVIAHIHYSRLTEQDVKETWVDTCARVTNGTYAIQKAHCLENDRPWDENKAVRDAHKMFSLMFQFKWLPPGRGLWAMGSPSVARHGGSPLNNCGFVSTKYMSAEPFCWLMNMSMLGVGVGFDTRGAGLLIIKRPGINTKDSFIIPDSREGWVESVRQLLNSYFIGSRLPNFDYNQIRKAGEKLKGFGGISAGPKPLRVLHQALVKILDSYVDKYVDSALIVDIMNLIGRCVVSGNIRRSAEVALGDFHDLQFINLKRDYEKVKAYRYISNNSVTSPIGEDYSHVAEITAQGGDIGYFWLTNARRFGRMNGIPDGLDYRADGTNPCVEQTLEHRELCNLVELFPNRHQSLHEYMQTVKIAYRYAKTVSLVKTGDEYTDSIIERNRRIGCSQSGLIRAMNRLGRATILDWSSKIYDYLTGLDADYSCWFSVNRSIKRTSIKPSGTIPLLPGETSALNYPEAEFYYRTIRIAANDPIIQDLERANYRIEENVYGSQGGGKTMVVYFPVHEPHFVRGKNDVSMWEQLETVAAFQRDYADNQVSATITFDEKEAKDIKHALDLYQYRLKSISFLPKSQKVYDQAPIQPITEKEYAKYCGKLRPLEITSNRDAQSIAGCDSESCTL